MQGVHACKSTLLRCLASVGMRPKRLCRLVLAGPSANYNPKEQ
jgi:hypothetical protein